MIGMCYIVNCTNAYYLMYLAVVPSLRNKNYGSMILKDLKEKYKVLFLSVDVPVDNISVRRKNFYLRNGFMILINFMKIPVLIMKYYVLIMSMK